MSKLRQRLSRSFSL